MNKAIYGALARVFALLLAIIGTVVIFAGMYAHGFVTEQLNKEKISMPAGEAITSLQSQESQDALKPFEGKMMTTGPQAKAYADHFIWEHMMSGSEGKTYQELGDVIKQAKGNNASEAELKKLNESRETLFKGNTLRGILLNAYGWWLVGSIAIWAGVAMIIVAVILAILAFTILREKKA